MRLVVNGVTHEVSVPPGTSLLTVLRSQLGLTGAKDACERGECGACTVLADGKPITACMVLAELAPTPIETAEGIAERALPLREAFADAGAFQCGFCTPGMIVRGFSILSREDDPDEPRLREALSGNICRCTGYAQIVDALLRAKASFDARADSADVPADRDGPSVEVL